MNNFLKQIKLEVYDKCSFELTDFKIESEGRKYEACNFKINYLKVICRNAKITPKKVGQFVTFWKRDENKITIPFKENDDFDFFVVNVVDDNKLGQFVFPKFELIKKGIISIDKKDGKRGFRVYPKWVDVENKQAQKSQQWQCKYFYEISNNVSIDSVIGLYEKNIVKKVNI